MGWSSGGELMSQIIRALQYEGVRSSGRKKIYTILIPAFEDMDCDVLYECVEEDKAFSQAYYELHPEELDNE